MPKTISPKVKSFILSLAAHGYSAADITAAMENDKDLYGHTLPSPRTVQHLVKRFREEDASETWTLQDCDNPDDAQIVLRHLAHAAEWAERHNLPMPKISTRLADLLIRVHRAAPSIPLWLAWSAAMGLLQGNSDDYWHLLLAVKPWESEEANRRFYALAKAFFGAPIGDLTKETRDDYYRRYPLGLTPFYIPQEGEKTPPAQT